MLIRKILLLLATITSLSACGGGGSDEIGVPQPEQTVSFEINESTQFATASVGLVNSESLLMLGQAMVETVNYPVGFSVYPITESCSNGGVFDIDLSDNDQSLSLSSGDTLRVDYRDCFRHSVNGILSGSAEVSINTFSNDDAGQNFELTANLTSLEIETVKFSGDLNIAFSENSLENELIVTPTNERFAIEFLIEEDYISEWNENFIVSKLMSFERARYELRYTGIIDSEFLGARLSVDTISPIEGYFATYPDTGEMTFSHNSNSISIVPNFVTNSYAFNLVLNNSVSTLLNWQNYIEGFIWWTPQISEDYFVDPLDINRFQVLYKTPEVWHQFYNPELTVNPEFRIQLSREIQSIPASTPLTLYTIGNSGREHVPVIIELSGAFLTLRPEQQLKHGKVYRFSKTIDVIDNFDNETSIILDQFKTRNNLTAIAKTDTKIFRNGDTVNLIGLESSASDESIVSYTWKQIGGQSIDIIDSNKSQASFTVPNSTTEQIFDFELRIENESGEYATDQITIQVIPQQSESEAVLYYDSAPGDYIGQGQIFLANNSTGRFNIIENSSNAISITYESSNGDPSSTYLIFAAPSSAILESGVYNGATRYPFQETGTPGLSVTSESRGCNRSFGSFEVFEIQFDDDRNVEVFSADFEQHCEQIDAPLLKGSIRFNSDISININ